jgi:CTP:molybdopterin cytidylyltransferase MocA
VPDRRVRPLILAAGSGSRFGGGKLSARVDGKPILRHVIDAARDAGLARPAIVLGPADPPGVDLSGTTIVRNPEPERGLASSLRIGWRSAASDWPLEAGPPDAVIVLLGDQPFVRAELLRELAAQPLDPDRPIVAPRFGGSGARNPVRIETSAAALVGEVAGDRGLGPIIDAHPEQVRWLDVEGDNPDVDTAADLATVAELAWAGRVRRNRDQVDRFREEPDGTDFYARVSSVFRDDPGRTGDPVLDALRARARPADTWLDIGAGAGRYALPLARSVRRVIALDPSPSMLGALREAMAEHGIDNIDVVEARWPEAVADGVAGMAAQLAAEVSLIAHVGYDVERIWPFVEAMERATRRECLAVLMERSPATLAERFWPELHGERRISLPALPAFVDLLAAHGRSPAVEMLESSRRSWASRDEIETYVRRQTWVAPGSAKDARMQRLIDEWLVPAADGAGVELRDADPLRVGLVSWAPVAETPAHRAGATA